MNRTPFLALRHPSGRALPSRGMAFLALLAPLVFLGMVAGCGGTDAPPPAVVERATPVAAMVIELRDDVEDRRWAGTLAPLRVHPLEAPVAGRVVSVAVTDGAVVRQGAAILRLEGLDQEARLEILVEREARLREELNRWRSLAAAGAAGPGEVVAAELRHSEAAEALAGLRATREGLSLRAGVAGRVVNLLAAPGMMVAAGQPLAAVEERASWGVRLRVSASEARFFSEAGELELVPALGAGIPVSRVVQAPDPQPGFVQVDLYPEPDGPATPGGVTVRYRSSLRAMVVPWTSVATDGNRSWVAVAAPDPAGDGYRVERRTVVLGEAMADGVQVLEGVEPGEWVLRYEPRSHPEGRRVEPRGPATPLRAADGDAP